MFRILVLHDFSANAYNALRVAMQLAQQYGGEVIFVHAMARPPVPATAPQDLFSDLIASEQAKWQEKLREEVQRLFQELSVRHKEVMYQLKVIPAPLVEAVVQLSELHMPDLVLMGSTGTSGLMRMIVGSNTLQMIKRTTRPLLVIPGGFIFEGFRKVTLVIRPDRFRYRAGINVLLRIARSYGAVLHFLFILDEDREKPALEDFLMEHNLWQEVKEHPYRLHIIPNAKRRKALKEHAEGGNTDLLVLFPSSKSVWEELFSESITEEMADQGKIPLLVFAESDS